MRERAGKLEGRAAEKASGGESHRGIELDERRLLIRHDVPHLPSPEPAAPARVLLSGGPGPAFPALFHATTSTGDPGRLLGATAGLAIPTTDSDVGPPP